MKSRKSRDDEERPRKPRGLLFFLKLLTKEGGKAYFRAIAPLRILFFDWQFRQKGNCERMEQTNEGRDAYLKLE